MLDVSSFVLRQPDRIEPQVKSRSPASPLQQRHAWHRLQSGREAAL